MKKFILSIILTCLWIGTSYAVPIYYTFSGQVSEITTIYDEPPDEFSALSISDPVTYKTLIDDELGTWNMPNYRL